MLDIERHDRFVELVLNRPEAGNAFDVELYEALATAVERAAADPAVGCVVLTATGPLFCAGADLNAFAAVIEQQDDAWQRGYDRLLTAVESFPKPLLAAVGGPAVGIGLTLLGHADIVLVSEAAKFRAPFARLGLVPEAGSTVTLPERLGAQRAAYLLFTGAWLSAADAVTWGLATRQVPADQLRPEALAIAKGVAAAPIESLVATKHLLTEGRASDAAAARRREDAAFVAALERDETAALVSQALDAVAGGNRKEKQP